MRDSGHGRKLRILELPGHGLATAAAGAANVKNAGDAMDTRVSKAFQSWFILTFKLRVSSSEFGVLENPNLNIT